MPIDDLTKQNIAQALWMQQYDASSIPPDILAKIESTQNSNAAYGSRFKKRLQQLKDNQLSFVNSRTDRYDYLLTQSDSLSAQQFYTRNLFLGPESSVGYQPLSENPDFVFPGIDAPQWKYTTGWQFFVGNFTDANQNHYSVELMFWQYAQLPPELGTSMGLNDIENQTVEMHLSICDPQSGIQYRATTTVVAGTTGLISFNPKPYTYRMGNNCIQGLNANGDLFPVNLNCLSFDLSDKSNVKELSINLTLENPKGIFMEGDNGCSPSVDGIGTLYYSASLLKLQKGAANTININGNTIELTDGSMWYDHQWGTGFMPSGATKHPVMRALQNLSEPAPGGWDWFMCQFYKNDNDISSYGEVQMTLSALHTIANKSFYFQTGATPPPPMTVTFNGKYIDVNNTATEIGGTLVVSEYVKVTASPDPDVYLPTDTWYPAHYQFTIDPSYTAVPKALLQFSATPLIATGQTGFFGNGLQYTEGGTIVKDSMGNEIGRGFAEGTNWADCNKGIVKLAGLPVSDYTIGLLKAPKVSFWMKMISFLCTILRKKELEKVLAAAKGL